MVTIISKRSPVFDFSVNTIRGESIRLEQYQGQVLLVVNVASRCLFTWQYSQLQSLYEDYRSQKFAVLGFPCNQFANQEPKSNSEIESFCSLGYHVTFPLFEKLDVNGPNAHPLFIYMKSQAKGWLASEGIKWNFTKFLIGRDGCVLGRYSPMTSPKRLRAAIEAALRSPIS
ncbi:MAG: glutathione peroxidase [Pirellula sp.]